MAKTDTERSQALLRCGMGVAIALVVLPFALFILWNVNDMLPEDAGLARYAFMAMVVLLLLSSWLGDRVAALQVWRHLPCWADTPRRRKSLIEAPLFAGIVAFCWVDPRAAGTAAVIDWLIAVPPLSLAWLLWSEALNAVWRRFGFDI